ncbi:hypothetical protein [Thalassospira lohafexi]|uniref:N-acetyltransferase domain-containing protein n=1 Tax=Thalassospira lohafexi TaxID=744227 RepID=A0A2N3L4U7_9PROT|nr:hypothetical protein [Thalassospira lohafexi]PKR57756.1 hypothetical protein COO92_13350 [Thalassospira lohafexi]
MTVIARLNETHLSAVIALHHDVLADADPTLVAGETDIFFQQHLSDCGQIFGILDQDTLLAYGVLGLPRPGDLNFGADHGLPPDQLKSVAHIDGVAVRRDCRGQNWQYKLTCHRLNAARTDGREIALTTVAPGNVASLINILSAGMIIRGLKEKYGGHRFLMRADLGKNPMPHQTNEITQWCPATDFENCHRLLKAGYVGVTFRKATSQSAPDIGWLPLDCT